MEKEKATHSTILAWEIPWTEEPGGLRPWGRKRIGHNLVIKQDHAKNTFKSKGKKKKKRVKDIFLLPLLL